ncbi:PD-(D/E)XK nuclease family protein [Telmatobacter sp. DSM 110680]|uniref:PD-(D/E)XK nuclease family protein n=1 Tax=Telmatobacter sp. DSM 110680 TaxID=3036704 RepID=A0AAU7DGP2_9BACT
MGTQLGAELDAWLREGGVMVASSDRAARALQADFHRRRRVEGLSTWPMPNIVDWKTFVRTAWEERNLDGRILLNSAQEQSIWAQIIHSDKHLPTMLPASVRRLASMAMEAHDLLCSYAPQFLRKSSRVSWDQDAGEFGKWLASFDDHCAKNSLISPSRLPLELIAQLMDDSSGRSPLCIAGFDRLVLTQRRLFDAWGPWKQFTLQDTTAHPSFYSVRDGRTELESCAWWCREQLASNPHKRLLVVTQDLSQRRGEIERAFLRFKDGDARQPFEFSLGIALTSVPLARSALLLLRWLGDALDENEIDWLLASGLAATPDESADLQDYMRRLRSRDLQRMQWSLEAFLNQTRSGLSLPLQWTQRTLTAQRSLKQSGNLQNPIDWADTVPHLLETIGWPAEKSQSSVAFQAQRRWQQALDTAGSLGFDGRRIDWCEFLSELQRAADESLFAPQSIDAPIQIAGPAESAGLTADAIWFLGADDDSWPGSSAMHPFLPLHVQRDSAMPHSSPQLDWQFSSAITQRLLASAAEVHFSCGLQSEEVETSPSRLIAQIAGKPQALPAWMAPPPFDPPIAKPFPDSSRVTFSQHRLHGGASALSAQSQCPFKAFTTARLDAKSWDAAEFGLTAKQRGQLLHDVLHSVWSGPPRGIRTHSDLIAQADLVSFVRNHVRNALRKKVPDAVRERMPAPYLDLEETRLVRLVTEWLKFESTRVPFTVEETEAVRTVTIAGLEMNLRLDRVDRLIDDSPLVIDYKTGTVDPRSWEPPRPDDLQLPLYKVLGLEPMQPSLFDSYGGPASGGLVFAKVRPGDTCFAGRVADAVKTIDPSLTGKSTLVKRKLTGLDESNWKEYIIRMAKDFIDGHAEADPRDYPKTCERCGLQSVCRIQEPENRARLQGEMKEDDDEG